MATLAVAAALGVAGCGGAGAYNDALGRAAPPGTDVPVAFADQPVTPATTAPSNADISAFCQDVLQLQALVPTLFRPSAGAGLAQARALVARLTTDAPKDLRPAALVMAQDTSRLITDFSSGPTDLADAARILTDPSYQQAFQQIVNYAASHC